MSRDSINAGLSFGNLNLSTVQKIIKRFLTKERIKTPLDYGVIKGNASPPEPEIRVKPYTKKELAKKLGILFTVYSITL